MLSGFRYQPTVFTVDVSVFEAHLLRSLLRLKFVFGIRAHSRRYICYAPLALAIYVLAPARYDRTESASLRRHVSFTAIPFLFVVYRSDQQKTLLRFEPKQGLESLYPIPLLSCSPLLLSQAESIACDLVHSVRAYSVRHMSRVYLTPATYHQALLPYFYFRTESASV